MRVEWERADLCGLTVGGWRVSLTALLARVLVPFCSGVTCVWSGRGQISVVWQWVGGWSAWQRFWLGYWSFLQWSDMRVEWERADLCGLTVGGWMVSLTALLARVLVLSAVEWHACGVGEGRSLWSDGGWVEGQPDSASGSATSPFCGGSDMRVEWERADLCGLTVGGWMVSLTALLGSGTGHFCSGVTCVWSGRGQISLVWQWGGGWSAWQRFWLGY